MKKFIVILLLLVSPVFAQDSNNIKILQKINELRVSKGLNILKYDASLLEFLLFLIMIQIKRM